MEFWQNVLAGIVAGVVSGVLVLFGFERQLAKREDRRQEPVRKLFVESCVRHVDDVARSWGFALLLLEQLNTSSGLRKWAGMMDAFNRRLDELVTQLGASASGQPNAPAPSEDTVQENDPTPDEETFRLLIARLGETRSKLEETLADTDTAWRFFPPSASMNLLEFRGEIVSMRRGFASLEYLARRPAKAEASTHWRHAPDALFRTKRLRELLTRISQDSGSNANVPELDFGEALDDQARQTNAIMRFLAAIYPELDTERILREGGRGGDLELP